MFRNLVFLLIIRHLSFPQLPFLLSLSFSHPGSCNVKFGVSGPEKYTEPTFIGIERHPHCVIAGGLFVGCRILFDLYWGGYGGLPKWLLSAGLLPNSLIVLILCTLRVFSFLLAFLPPFFLCMSVFLLPLSVYLLFIILIFCAGDNGIF